MKKFLLLFAVLFTTVGAWAQTSYDGIYTLQVDVDQQRGYVVAGEGYPDYPVLSEITLNPYQGNSVEAIENGKNWYITAFKSGYAFYNVAVNKFLVGTGSEINFGNEPYQWNISANGNYLNIQDATHTAKYLSGGCGRTADNRPVAYDTNKNDGGAKYTITEVGTGTADFAEAIAAANAILAKYATVTVKYVFTYNGEEKYTQETVCVIGESYPEITASLPFGVSASIPGGSVTSDGAVDGVKTVEIALSVNLPFEVSTDYATAHWYALKIRDDGFTYLSYDSSKEYIPASASGYSIKNLDNYMWAFIGNPFDGFKVINKAAGDAKILSAPSAPTGNNDAGQLARMVEETGATGNIVWNLKAPTHNNAVANVFYIEHPTATSYAFNRQSFNSENALCYWDRRDTGSAMLVEELYDFSQFGDLLFNGEQMQDGKIYRIQSSTRKTFTGIDGYTCNMKNQDYDANNPGQLWKYVVDGDKAYLQNVYAGLYPQYVVGGGDQTTAIGTSKDYAFTYSINNANVEHIWNISFGGRQVNIEGNGNVNWWTGENAHHYIYKVEATDDELATMCMNWYNANKYVAPEATASSYQKIDIDPSATEIISPSEFAAPSVINEAIDNLTAIEGTLGMEITSAGDIHTLFGALSVYAPAVNALTAYKNAVTAHGELLSIAYTPKAEWGTIILPINWANPEGWTRYSCASTEGNVLALTEYASGGGSKNTPMIIQVAEDKIGTTYQMIGYSNGAGTENVTAGLLTGVLEDNTEVPAGSYVLARQISTGKIGFFPVAEDAHYGLDKYKCYLTLPVSATRYNALFFEGEETGIESIETENAKAEIYDLAGRRVQKAQKGLYIVNGVKVIK